MHSGDFKTLKGKKHTILVWLCKMIGTEQFVVLHSQATISSLLFSCDGQ